MARCGLLAILTVFGAIVSSSCDDGTPTLSTSPTPQATATPTPAPTLAPTPAPTSTPASPAARCDLTGTWNVNRCICGCGPIELVQRGQALEGLFRDDTPTSMACPVTGTNENGDVAIRFQNSGFADTVYIEGGVSDDCNTISGRWRRPATGEIESIRLQRR